MWKHYIVVFLPILGSVDSNISSGNIKDVSPTIVFLSKKL